MEDFVQCPSDELLEQCTKEQLVNIAHYYSVDVDSKQTKETLKSAIKAHLLDCAVLMDRGGKSIVTMCLA